MKARISIDTVTDVAHFVLAVAGVKSPVYLTNDKGMKIDGKSFLGVAHATEFDEIWCECEEDIYTRIEHFIVSEG